MEFTKADWLHAVAAVQAHDTKLVSISPENMSPTFGYGLWTGAFEHTRKFRSVVLRHRDADQVHLQQGWVRCSASDVRKNWFFRVNNCAPSRIKDLLAQLEAAEG